MMRPSADEESKEVYTRYLEFPAVQPGKREELRASRATLLGYFLPPVFLLGLVAGAFYFSRYPRSSLGRNPAANEVLASYDLNRDGALDKSELTSLLKDYELLPRASSTQDSNLLKEQSAQPLQEKQTDP